MTEHRTLLTCGEHAVLVEVGGLDQVVSLDRAVREAVTAGTPGFTDVVDIIPAATTVLVVVAAKAGVAALGQALATLPAAAAGEVAGSDQVVEIPVRYDGADLADVAELTGLSIEEVDTAGAHRD